MREPCKFLLRFRSKLYFDWVNMSIQNCRRAAKSMDEEGFVSRLTEHATNDWSHWNGQVHEARDLANTFQLQTLPRSFFMFT